MIRPLLCLAILLFVPLTAAAQRLPIIAMPEHYALRFTPDLAREAFDGLATIRVRVLRPTTEIVLHAAELRIESASVSASGHTQAAAVSTDSGAETATLRIPEPLAPGLAELRIEYSGILNRQLRGFYISEANNRKYAVTQLEATDARRMFPSFDEPQFKATFDVTAVIDQGDYAISNGSLASVEPGPAAGKQTFTFGTTARMSTYLVALAVGDFECAEDTIGDTPLRVCATPGKGELTRFALDATKAVLQYFNDYFAIDYPFTKLDQVAIPDFAAGAMENTGAIFYRESILLVDPRAASLATRKRAALVIAHEIAHQWFGNLVTMKWWDDLWLNEGFATWMEYKAVDSWQPEWQVHLDEVQSVQSAMAIDALAATRPIRSRAETPDEINELFDPIAYEKGAAILNMVESYVGEQAFRGGVNGYLETYEYDNATAENFWTMLTRATNAPVDQIMKTFVDQPGIPLVGVSTSCRNGTTTVSLTQERYSQDADRTAAALQTWAIPVCFRTPGTGDTAGTCTLLTAPKATTTIEGCAPWVAANTGGNGYYRTAYADSVLRALTAAGPLKPTQAITLLSDEWALVRAGRHGVGRFLNVAGSIAEQTASAPVAESLGARLAYVHEYLTSQASANAYEQWVRTQLGPALERLGPESQGRVASDQTRDQPRLRAALMGTLGAAGRAPDVLSTARRVVDEYLRQQSAEIDPTLLNTLVGLAAMGGDRELYDRYLARSQAAATPEERYRFLYALAAFGDPTLLKRTMELAFSEDVRSQDRGLLIAAVLGNPAGRDLAWDMVQARWSELEKTQAGFGGTARIIEGLGAFCDAGKARDIRQFFAAHPISSAERTLRQTLERIDGCVALAESQKVQLGDWLKTGTSPGDSR